MGNRASSEGLFTEVDSNSSDGLLQAAKPQLTPWCDFTEIARQWGKSSATHGVETDEDDLPPKRRSAKAASTSCWFNL